MREVAVERDFAQADYDAEMLELSDLGVEMHGTVPDLLRGGLVSRWRATHDGGDPGIAKFQSVVAMSGLWLVREAGLIKNGIHEVARSVAGEGPACTVGAVGSGGKSEDEHSGARIAKARHGTRPVGFVSVGAPLGLSDSLAVGSET